MEHGDNRDIVIRLLETQMIDKNIVCYQTCEVVLFYWGPAVPPSKPHLGHM